MSLSAEKWTKQQGSGRKSDTLHELDAKRIGILVSSDVTLKQSQLLFNLPHHGLLNQRNPEITSLNSHEAATLAQFVLNNVPLRPIYV